MALTTESAKVQKILKDRFGFSSFKPGQKEVVDLALAGENLLVVLPTGAGKSLCYQLPALITPGTAIVISPLIALMKDQKQKLDKLKIQTLELNSFISASDQEENLNTVQDGKTEFLYVTPEKFAQPAFLKSIQNLKIDLLVIDEAHCISQWGHDFRPAYLQIAEGWKFLGKPQVLAVTATATSEVIEDIKAQLNLPRLKVISKDILRKNLFYEAHILEKVEEKIEKLKDLLKGQSGPGIIYSATVKDVETLYDQLSDQGYEVYKYHGRLAASARSQQRVQFMKSKKGVMIATNAFGMGIDKANIRFIIHLHFPGSLEAYYQESGRAGRDGKAAKCILLYLKKDKATQAFFNSGKYPSLDNLKKLYATLQTQHVLEHCLDLTALNNLEGVAKTKVAALLSLLKKQGIVKLKKKNWQLMIPNLTETQLLHLHETFHHKKHMDADKLKKIIRYSQTALCRWQFLIKYFNPERAPEPCGHCDNCAKGTSDLVLVSESSDGPDESNPVPANRSFLSESFQNYN